MKNVLLHFLALAVMLTPSVFPWRHARAPSFFPPEQDQTEWIRNSVSALAECLYHGGPGTCEAGCFRFNRDADPAITMRDIAVLFNQWTGVTYQRHPKDF
jgi:hypothetical protein